MGFREGDQLQKQGEGEEGQEIQGHTGWKEKAQKTSVEAALDLELENPKVGKSSQPFFACSTGRIKPHI